MKKLFSFPCVIGMVLCLVSSVTAGGIDNKTDWSVEYIRTFNRNAAKDAADIVLYNPAGTVKMEDGLYGNMSAHYIAKDYTNKIDGGDKEGEDPSVIPGVFALYKKTDWSCYFGFSNFGGGGKITFDNGSQTTNKLGYAMMNVYGPGLVSDQRSAGESQYLGYTFGGAYKINNIFAGIDAKDMTPEAPELDANTVGAGVVWKAVKDLTLNFALGNAFYTSDHFTYSPSPGVADKVEYEKNNFFLGFGLEYKFM